MPKVEKLPEVVGPNEIQVIEPSPMEMAQSFLTAGGDLAVLKDMMNLQEKWERREAEKAFFKATASFKKNPPKIFKDRHVDYTSKSGIRTEYDHATLGNVVEKICMALSEHGLTADFDQKQENNQLTVTCYLTHELGFSKKTSMTAPPDTSGGKNGIQGLGSTNSYLQRYTLLALTGLATHDMDNDGQLAEPIQYITGKQASQILDMINSIDNFSEASFLSWAKLESIEMMPVYAFGKNMNALNAKAKAAV